MKLGVTLPTFSGDAGAVLEAARAAEAAGMHGVFSFDHQWPIGHPERPSLSLYPMLGAVAAVTRRLGVGTLVARVGLLPDEVVAASLEGLGLVLGDRLVAGLGTGDEESEPEHERYGLPYLGLRARTDSLEWVLGRLQERRIECWVGAGRHVTNEVAGRTGAVLNFWGATPERLAAARVRYGVPVTWAGPIPDGADRAADLLSSLEEAGARWAVWGWPHSLEAVREAAVGAGLSLAEGS